MNSNIKQKIDEDQKDRITDLTNKRAIMLNTLATAGIQKITGYYDSCGDSTIAELDPENGNLSEKDEKSLENLVWDFANAIDPTLENNGASGEFKWDIPNDRIKIIHKIIAEKEQTSANCEVLITSQQSL